MYSVTAAMAAEAADSKTQAQNQGIPDFVLGYNYEMSRFYMFFFTTED
jgi:hypothetical protein